MNAEQKQQAIALVKAWGKTALRDARRCNGRPAAEMVEAQTKTEADDSWPKYGNECWAIDGDGDLFDFVWNLEG